MPARNKIIELIEKFDKFYNQLHSPDYNETELRVEYINPFFGELGWDVDNKQGYSQVYREVIHEAKMKRKDATGRPDYSFRIGGVPKFYVETKKPAVNIETDPNPALQLRSYIWTAKLPLGILTDFEEFAVYDGRIKPNKNDKASTARVLFIKYHDYPEKWDKIASIFSKEAILKGSFDEFAESTKAKKGTSEEFYNLPFEIAKEHIESAMFLFDKLKFPTPKVFSPPGWCITSELINILNQKKLAIAGSMHLSESISDNSSCAGFCHVSNIQPSVYCNILNSVI